jgi:non-ribosomal peptide synthetase component F
MDLFEEQVERTPDKIAAAFEDQELNYRQLNARANAIAAHLKALGAGPDARVGICVGRSIEMLAGMIGILKAGAGLRSIGSGVSEGTPGLHGRRCAAPLALDDA